MRNGINCGIYQKIKNINFSDFVPVLRELSGKYQKDEFVDKPIKAGYNFGIRRK